MRINFDLDSKGYLKNKLADTLAGSLYLYTTTKETVFKELSDLDWKVYAVTYLVTTYYLSAEYNHATFSYREEKSRRLEANKIYQPESEPTNKITNHKL